MSLTSAPRAAEPARSPSAPADLIISDHKGRPAAYLVEPLPDGPDGEKVVRLHKAGLMGSAVYDVHAGPDGPGCTCPDATLRDRVCKHIRHALAAGLLGDVEYAISADGQVVGERRDHNNVMVPADSRRDGDGSNGVQSTRRSAPITVLDRKRAVLVGLRLPAEGVKRLNTPAAPMQGSEPKSDPSAPARGASEVQPPSGVVEVEAPAKGLPSNEPPCCGPEAVPCARCQPSVLLSSTGGAAPGLGHLPELAPLPGEDRRWPDHPSAPASTTLSGTPCCSPAEPRPCEGCQTSVSQRDTDGPADAPTPTDSAWWSGYEAARADYGLTADPRGRHREFVVACGPDEADRHAGAGLDLATVIRKESEGMEVGKGQWIRDGSFSGWPEADAAWNDLVIWEGTKVAAVLLNRAGGLRVVRLDDAGPADPVVA